MVLYFNKILSLLSAFSSKNHHYFSELFCKLRFIFIQSLSQVYFYCGYFQIIYIALFTYHFPFNFFSLNVRKYYNKFAYLILLFQDALADR